MQSISIYIHWPFCLSLCPYCDFNSYIGGKVDHDRWLEVFKIELAHFAPIIRGKEVKSIFFGGGTPSLMQAYVVEGIIDKIAELGILSESCEITLEANPTSFEIGKFREFKAAGVNRVSLGVQALNAEDLLLLGRKHSSTEAIKAIKSASKIFERYSFDLIYARPNQTLIAWKRELKEALELANGHISLYQLTIEKGTPFFGLVRNGKLLLPPEEISACMYEWTTEYLQENDYNRYEISNYATKEEECKHNLCYWNYEEYIGIGAGAHSRIHNESGITAVMTYHQPEKWLQSIEKCGHAIQRAVNLSRSEILQECVMMGTRLPEGIREQKLQELLQLGFADILDMDVLDYYISNEIVSLSDGRLRLLDKGLLLHNYVIPKLIKFI